MAEVDPVEREVVGPELLRPPNRPEHSPAESGVEDDVVIVEIQADEIGDEVPVGLPGVSGRDGAHFNLQFKIASRFGSAAALLPG